METEYIEETIIKMAYLLALSFGEAGAKIIGQNLSSNKELDPLMAGIKCMALFGFCDIHHFQEISIAIETWLMNYVNLIADVVHSEVDRYGGSANKNMGEAFLLVWKIEQDVKISNQNEYSLWKSQFV